MNLRLPLMVKIMLPLMLIIILTIGISGYRVYAESTARLRSEMQARMERIALFTAGNVNASALEEVRVPTDLDSPAYVAVQDQLNQSVIAGNLTWAGIYYRDGDYLYYWVDIDSTGVAYPFFYATPAHRAAFADGQPHEIEYADEYGSYYGYVAPITRFGGNGIEVIGIVETVLSGESRTLLQQATLRRVLPILLGGMAIAIVCATLLTLLVFNRPLRRLKRGAAALAQGQFGTTIALRSRDELGDLAQTFNTMSSQLDRLYQERASRERMQRELEIARGVQQALFPKTAPLISGLEIAAYCQPHSETSGDFYDLMPLADGQLGVVVGDVSGKSIPAAMLMVSAYSTIRSEARDHSQPGVVLSEANAVMHPKMPRSMFVAASYARIDPRGGRMIWANAGQIYPFLLHRQRPADPVAYPHYLEATGNTLPLGISPEVRYDDQHLSLLPGDMVLFYTDGVIEAMNLAGELYGFERLEVLVRSLLKDVAPQQLLAAVVADVAQFVGAAPQHDDITLVAVRLAEELTLQPSHAQPTA